MAWSVDSISDSGISFEVAWSVDSVSDSGISFEVGLVVHGTISKRGIIRENEAASLESHNNLLKESSNLKQEGSRNDLQSDHTVAKSNSALSQPTVCIVRDRVLYPTSQLTPSPLQPLLPPFLRVEYFEPFPP